MSNFILSRNSQVPSFVSVEEKQERLFAYPSIATRVSEKQWLSSEFRSCDKFVDCVA